MTDKLTELRGETGRIYRVRPLPKHFFLYFGELPSNFSERAILALKKGDKETFGREALASMSPQQLRQAMVFTREAVNFALVEPKISLTPKDETEISPFDISENDFEMLASWALKGGEKEGLDSFRGRPEQTAANSSNGKKFRKASK